MVCVGLELGLRWVSFGLFIDAFRLAFFVALERHFLDVRLFFRCDNSRTISYFDPAIGEAQAHLLHALHTHFRSAHFRVALVRLPSRLSLRRSPLVFLCVHICETGIATRVSRARIPLRDRLGVAVFSSYNGRRSRVRGSCFFTF